MIALLFLLGRLRTGGDKRWPLIATVVLGVGVLAAWPHARLAIDRPAALAGTLDAERANALVETLLKNVYRAFDFREEDDVYDKLALTVSGDLLADIYLQSRQSFAVQQAGGAQAKVQDVALAEFDSARNVYSLIGPR